jgi:hypothetical protein
VLAAAPAPKRGEGRSLAELAAGFPSGDAVGSADQAVFVEEALARIDAEWRGRNEMMREKNAERERTVGVLFEEVKEAREAFTLDV